MDKLQNSVLHTDKHEKSMASRSNADESHRHGIEKTGHRSIQTVWFHLYKVQKQATSSTATEITTGLIFGRRCKLIRTAIGNVLYLDLGCGDMNAFLYVKIHQVRHPVLCTYTYRYMHI